MLHDFITENRAELLSRTRVKILPSMSGPPASTQPLVESGIPSFLTQVAETLRLERGHAPLADDAIGVTAAQHGRELLAKGCTLSQVVHDYGDVCQAITELAAEKDARIGPAEFQILNRCLDTAIAEAVTAHGRLLDEATRHEEVERLGQLSHELRNLLQTALLSFEALKSGRVGVTGSTASVLGRSLTGLRALVDSAVCEVRIAGRQRRDRLSLRTFLDEVALAARLHADARSVRLAVEPADPSLEVEADEQLLTSALMNLLQNAFKFTREQGRVVVRTRGERGRAVIEVEDECGGMATHDAGDSLRSFADRRRSDRSGLGLGLSITRKAVHAIGGEISSRDLPGKGCVFAIDLPVAAPLAGA